jgi:hypothetical protein
MDRQIMYEKNTECLHYIQQFTFKQRVIIQKNVKTYE